jgi:hypothetical protein
MKKTALILIACISMIGCATVSGMNRIHIGMPKDQVIRELGRPISVSAKDGAEIMNYRFIESTYDAWMNFGGGNVPYYVKVVDGKVAEYGRQDK